MRSRIGFGISMLLAVASITVSGCGGNGKSTPSAPATYTVGGAITGLTGTGLVLQNNGGDSLTVSAGASTFTFSTPVASNGVYSVTILTQPAGQNCTVTTGSGTATANITNVAVACVQMNTIGGTITGLTETGLVLQDNGGDNFAVNPGATSYTFATQVASGGAYSVAVFAQPLGEECMVTNSTGTATANVVNADVSCIQAYTINGTITGLTAAGLVLQDNGGSNLTVSANATSFTFAAPVLSGGAYSVTVLTQPASQSCTVANGSGTAVADVTNVSVVCVGDWTWMGGSSVVGFNDGQSGVYGTLGTPGPANVPGGRQQSVTWSDSSGGVWLFGGFGYDSAGMSGQLNDLWKFDPTLGANGEWTWMSGSSTTILGYQTSGDVNGRPGIYGTLGTASPATVPGGREQVASWRDAAGNLWLFGGLGIDANANTGYLNDLWKFVPALGANGEWTWMGGSSTVPNPDGGQAGVYGTLGTAASTNVPGGRYGAITWTDASGNLWLYGGQGYDSTGTLAYLNDLWEYTAGAKGTLGNWTWMGGSATAPPNAGGPFASEGGQPGVYGTLGVASSANFPGGRSSGVSWTDASGKFWLFGGLGADSTGTVGYLNDLWMFDPKSSSTGAWTWMSGSSTIPGSYSGQPGDYGVQGTTNSANVPGGRFSPVSWIDASGNLWLLGGQGFDWTGTSGLLNDLWAYSANTGQWTWMGGSNTVPPSTNYILENGQPGVYGVLGTPAPGNNPGGRLGGAPWVDASGNLWFFGGQSFDANGVEGNLNDMWRYQP
jgi:N-acetylneuraminic acid mutarotase